MSTCVSLGVIVDSVHGPHGAVPIYSCSIHGRCSQKFIRNTIRICARCSDYCVDNQSNISSQSPISAINPDAEAINSEASSVSQETISPSQPSQPAVAISAPARAQRASVRARGRGQATRLLPPSYVPIHDSNIITIEQGIKYWKRPPIWQYGLTTVPDRRKELLPRTIKSLEAAGFGHPTLFVDGDWDYKSWNDEFHLPVVCRYPKIRTYGNWILALAELYIRNVNADYYVIFQDDLLASKNLRLYLEKLYYPEKGYWNLYTFPHNQVLSSGNGGFYKASMSYRGTGALGLVFDHRAILILLAHDHIVKRAQDPTRGHKYVDGGVVETMNQEGWVEYVHNPSLLQHTGLRSTSGNMRQPSALSFRGEDFDCLSLLNSVNKS